MTRSLLLSLLLASAIPGRADDPVAAALKELKAGPPTAESLARTVPLLADPAARNPLRNALLALDPFPSKELVALLSDPALAVRLAALELLEEKAGGDFAYNPWSPPGAPENEGPLARWNQWSGEKPQPGGRRDLLGEEQRRGYLRDLLGDDADKSARARRMLEADGLGAVGFLESFLADSPGLPAGVRAKVREAQYQIVLARPLGPQASATARQLAFGSRDQTLAALGTLRGAGLVALPILRDFLQHADPLVRETAIDAILSAGGAQAVPVVGPVLRAESDVNVIHGALRRLKEVPGDESSRIAASFLTHADEDLLVSAIQACLKLAGGAESDHMFGRRTAAAPAKGVQAEVNAAVIKALDDPRWRVRTAALEFIAGRKVAEAKTRCVELLSDPDEFVRFSAIKAASALRADGTAAKLKEMFLADPGMVGPVFEGYAALGRQPDAAMLEKLAAYPADARLAAVRAAEADSKLTPVILRFAADPDLDVACAALRYLSADEDRVETPEVASVLVAALRSGDPAKRAASLDRLDLPAVNAAIDPALLAFPDGAPDGAPTALDPLYDALLAAAAAGDPAQAAGPAAKVLPGAQGELLKEIAAIAAGDSPEAFRAALCLSKAGEPNGLKILTKRLPALSTAERAAIAGQLYSPSRNEALELLRQLLRDPVDEVRSAAAGSAMSNSSAPAFLSMVLGELAAPAAKLQPHEIYSYQFESCARQSGTSRALRAWALGVLGDPQAADGARILACIGLRQQFPAAATEPVLALAKSATDRWVRRAAWHALGSAGSAAFRRELATLAADPAPQVRAALPEVVGRMNSAWRHRFDDTRSSDDASWSSDRDERRLFAEARAALEKLAATDPSPELRFESMLALLSHGQTIDAEAFAALIPRQPEDSEASARVAAWMAENTRRLGPGLAPIAAALDTSKIQSDRLHEVIARLAPKGDGGPGFASFAALVAGAETPADAPQQSAAPAEDETPKAVRDHLKLVYFFKPGCAECEKASQLLETIGQDFPQLSIERHNLTESRGTLLNQALCSRFGVPSNKHTIAPAIFTQAGFLVREDIVPQALGRLLAATRELPRDDAWSVLDEPQIAAAREVVEERFQSLTLPVVLLAGLIDGVNPCAFATIIFFLSYLQIARRTPREMLLVGAAFISAVFLAYFLAGLVLHKVLEQITGRIAGIKPFLDYGFAALALLAAFLSFRDAFKARAGKLDEMTLQLPGFLKDRIRGVIRGGAKARRFVIAAFLAGFVISFLELACTGQVYAPIIYSIQQGKLDAVAWLFAYNLAFILPLVVIFLLAFTGMSNKALIHFQTKHTFGVKIALGLVFIALAAVILFGGKLLHR